MKLGVDFNAKNFTQVWQGSTFPQVLLDSKKIGGCTDTVQYLRENKLI